MLRPGRGAGGGLPTASGPGSAAGPASPYGRPPPPQSPYGRPAGGTVGGGGLPAAPYASPGAGGGGGSGGTYGGYSGGYSGGGGYNNNGGSGGGSAYGGYTGGAGAAYGGYSGGAASSSNTISSKGKKRRSANSTNVLQTLANPLIWTSALAFIFFVLTIRGRLQQSSFLSSANAKSFKQILDNLRRAKAEEDHLRSELRASQDSYHRVVAQQESETLRLQAQARELQAKLDASGGAVDHSHIVKQQEAQLETNALEKEHMSLREQALKTQVQLLQQAASRESRRSVIQRFGPGPHFCEFTVMFPTAPEETRIRTFIVEMAPLEHMPHAVHLFLNQVAHNLWNTGWFYINGPHVLQAGPQADEYEMEHGFAEGEDERSSALRPFRAHQLESLAFPEYSDAFPHLPWTLGFTGRPGGPDFYINKVDNTIAHGPGGQDHHDLAESADACFAKVVKGFDTLSAMTNSQTIKDSSEYQYFFEDPIQIVKIAIVESPFGDNTTNKEASSSGSSGGSASGGNTGDVHVNGEAGGVKDSLASSRLLEKIQEMRENAQGSRNDAAARERMLHERLEREARDMHRDPRDEANSRKRHGPKRMIHRPELDHMVEP